MAAVAPNPFQWTTRLGHREDPCLLPTTVAAPTRPSSMAKLSLREIQHPSKSKAVNV